MKKISNTFFIITLILFAVSNLNAQHFSVTPIYKQINSKNKKQKIEGIKALSIYYTKVIGAPHKADSVAQSYILYCLKNNLKPETVDASIFYASKCLSRNISKAENYIEQAISTAKLLDDHILMTSCLLAMAKLKNREGNTVAAMQFLDEARVANVTNNKECTFENNMIKGEILQNTGNLKGSFNQFTNAILIAKEIPDDSLLCRAYIAIMEFFNYNEMYARAMLFSDSCDQIWKRGKFKSVYDSLYIRNLYLESLVHINPELAIPLGENLIAASENMPYIREHVFSTLRGNFLKTDNFNKLCEFYCEKYPHELPGLKSKSKFTYYRVLALIKEKEKKYDSVVSYLQLAEREVLAEKNPAQISNFYYRQGQYYQRRNNKTNAINSMDKALKAAQQSGYLPFVINAATQLEKLYLSNNDMTNAYKSLSIVVASKDSLNNQINKEDVLSVESDFGIKNTQQVLDREHAKHKKSKEFQISIIIAIIIMLFLGLWVASHYIIPLWVIKLTGYIFVVMLFEFIIFLIDEPIHHFFHGAPIPIVLVKVALIGAILPVHHAMEHRVVKHLIKNNRLAQGGTIVHLKKMIGYIKNWLKIEHEEHE